MKTRRLHCVFVVLVAVGCSSNYYEVELTPKDVSLQRELTCWRELTSQGRTEVAQFPDDELRQIAAAYDVPVPADTTKKHKFLAEFATSTPSDVGGSGSYTLWKTPLGSVSAYVERFRGNDNLVVEVERRLQAAGRLGDIIAGWLESELKEEPGFVKLKQFLDDDFRRDLKNISLYGWAFDIVSHQEDAEVECLVRVGQYLSERGYISPTDLPELARAMQQIDHQGPDKVLALLQRLTATKMGVAEDEPIPDCLHFLAEQSSIQDSFNSYLADTDEFRQLVKTWQEERAAEPELEKPTPEDVLEPLVSQAYLSNVELFGGGDDNLSVSLNTPNAPFLTNGDWDGDSNQVSWSHRLVARDSDRTEFPTLLFAFWSSPSEKVQREHFGRVVLEGQSLGTYCIWHRGLSESETAEWDEFVDSLEPNDELQKRLRAFHFSHESKAADDELSPLASTPRDLILRALRGED